MQITIEVKYVQYNNMKETIMKKYSFPDIKEDVKSGNATQLKLLWK